MPTLKLFKAVSALVAFHLVLSATPMVKASHLAVNPSSPHAEQVTQWRGSAETQAKFQTMVKASTYTETVSVMPAEPLLSAAFHPTLSRNDKGADVIALQYALRYWGYGVVVDGNFGLGTEGAVRKFQKSKGLTIDGIVGPNTWGALLPTVQNGSSGDAVRALQSLLNEKRGAGLTVDGAFGPATQNAVTNFQSHASIAVDGIVGQDTWKNLLWHYDKPIFGASTGLCYYRSTSAHWGTASAIKWLETAALAFYLTNGSRLVPVGDISLEHGGDIAGHDSHEDGLDVDLRLIRTDNAQCSGGTTWQNTNYDQARTRAFILSIYAAAPGHIKLIFFNDPVLINEGLTSPFTGHDDHIHIRFCEAAHPNPNIPFRYDCLVNWPYRELSLPFIQK